MQIQTASLTDVGKMRELNEDRVWAQVYSPSEGENIALLVVCDGMGGHLGGEVASHWAVEAIKAELNDMFCPGDPRGTVRLSTAEIEAAVEGHNLTNKLPLSELAARSQLAVERANRVVFEYAQKKPKEAADAGTTLTMALVKGNAAIIANVGDSRTYLVRNHSLTQITKDHSLVANLVAAGQIKPSEIFHHPQRNIIFRSLGQKDSVSVDIFQEILEPGDVLFLCSDGLWEMVQDEKAILKIIERSADLDTACRKLVDAANAGGGEDNISVVLGLVK